MTTHEGIEELRYLKSVSVKITREVGCPLVNQGLTSWSLQRMTIYNTQAIVYLTLSLFFLFTETVEKIKDLMKKGEELKAQELTGDQSLEILRDSLLIGFMVHHKLSEDQGPPGKPPRDAPLPKMLLHDPKMANVPRRLK